MIKGSHHTKEHKEYMSKRMKGVNTWTKGRKLPKETIEKMIKSTTGEKHHRWKGEKVGYHALHVWVIRHKGTPNLCEICGTTEAKKFEWANKDHLYKRNLDDYFRACTKCHRKYDYENFGIPPTIGKNVNSHKCKALGKNVKIKKD